MSAGHGCRASSEELESVVVGVDLPAFGAFGEPLEVVLLTSGSLVVRVLGPTRGGLSGGSPTTDGHYSTKTAPGIQTQVTVAP
jgi:hypothetical protein